MFVGGLCDLHTRSPISLGAAVGSPPTHDGIGVHNEGMASWAEFEAAVPDLAAFGAERLRHAPAYLATVRKDGAPRVHPVSPIIGGGRLFLFMEPTSPKGNDLRQRGVYAIHSGVADSFGTGGEFFLSGRSEFSDDPELRTIAEAAAGYDPAERYILFVLSVENARCNGYGDVSLPTPSRWPESAGEADRRPAHGSFLG